MISPFSTYSNIPDDLIESMSQINTDLNTDPYTLNTALNTHIYKSVLLQLCHTSSTEISSIADEATEIKKMYLLQNTKILNRTHSENLNTSSKKKKECLHNSAGILAHVQKVRFSNKINVRYYADKSFKYKDTIYNGL